MAVSCRFFLSETIWISRSRVVGYAVKESWGTTGGTKNKGLAEANPLIYLKELAGDWDSIVILIQLFFESL